MDIDTKDFITSCIVRNLVLWMDCRYAERIANKLYKAVWKDVQETADTENWNGGDVDIALRRVLLKRLGLNPD